MSNPNGPGENEDLLKEITIERQPKSRDACEEAAENGDNSAKLCLGMMYFLGYGNMPVDIKKSYDIFMDLAENGDPQGSYYAGIIHYFGKFGTPDYDQAFTAFQKAAKSEFAPAEFFLGRMYLFGRGTRRSNIFAKFYFQKALAHGHEHAKRYLTLAEQRQEADEKSDPDLIPGFEEIELK